MITYIKISGFKSFHNFEMEFTPFTVIAGANASGKSNLFDALKLLSLFAETDNLKKVVSEQRGDLMELFTQYGQNEYATEMQFEVEMLVNKTVKDAWGNQTALKYTRLRYELKISRAVNATGIEDLIVKYEYLTNLKHQDDKWIKKYIPSKEVDYWRPKVVAGKRGIPYILTESENEIPTVLVPQDGTQGNKRRFPLINATRTVLSSFDSVEFPHVLAAKEEMKSWNFLQLNPEDLRQPTSKTNGENNITPSGKNLAGALFRISLADEYNLIEISRKLATFLPDFISVEVVDDKENKQYLIKLKDLDKKEYTSRVLSEGTLRILALCILYFDDSYTGLLCFEEPENGIHPFRIRAIVELLKDLSADFSQREIPLRQIIVNTHSPKLVANILDLYIDDKDVTLWLSQMARRKTTVSINNNNQDVSLSITSISNPFENYKSDMAGPLFKEDDNSKKKKFGMEKVLRYLESIETESVKNKLTGA